MPFSRQRPRIPPTGRVTIRLTPAQRDVLLGEVSTPKNLGHALHRAAVRRGELTLRVTRDELDAIILGAANAAVPDRAAERALATFLRYLESMEDRFADPEAEEGDEAGDAADADKAPKES